MAIEMLDVNAVWSKIAAGFKGGKRWKSPRKNPNPSSFSDGPTAEARQVTDGNSMSIPSAFGGKTFNGKR